MMQQISRKQGALLEPIGRARTLIHSTIQLNMTPQQMRRMNRLKLKLRLKNRIKSLRTLQAIRMNIQLTSIEKGMKMTRTTMLKSRTRPSLIKQTQEQSCLTAKQGESSI